MSTALAPARAASSSAVSRVGAEFNFGDLLKLGEALVATGFLPEHIKNGGQCAAIILTGRELGMEPMRAVRSLQMVKGKVIENADSQLARFKTDGGRAHFERLDEKAAVLFLRHPNGDEHTETFTLVDAERAGLTKPSYKGEPSMFTKFPKPMLRSRVITAGLKSIGWEGGAGAYDPAEMGLATISAPSAYVATEEVAPEAPEVPAMTLEEALIEPLRGPSTGWGGYGGKPLGDLSPRLVDAARTFFADKLAKKPEDAKLARQVEALRLVYEWQVSEGYIPPEETRESFAEKLDASMEAESEGLFGDGETVAAKPKAGGAKAARAIPSDVSELQRWSTADLQATALATLKLPAFANSRDGFLQQIDLGLTHSTAVALVSLLGSMMRTSGKKSDPYALLPGEEVA